MLQDITVNFEQLNKLCGHWCVSEKDYMTVQRPVRPRTGFAFQHNSQHWQHLPFGSNTLSIDHTSAVHSPCTQQHFHAMHTSLLHSHLLLHTSAHITNTRKWCTFNTATQTSFICHLRYLNFWSLIYSTSHIHLQTHWQIHVLFLDSFPPPANSTRIQNRICWSTQSKHLFCALHMYTTFTPD